MRTRFTIAFALLAGAGPAAAQKPLHDLPPARLEALFEQAITAARADPDLPLDRPVELAGGLQASLERARDCLAYVDLDVHLEVAEGQTDAVAGAERVRTRGEELYQGGCSEAALADLRARHHRNVATYIDRVEREVGASKSFANGGRQLQAEYQLRVARKQLETDVEAGRSSHILLRHLADARAWAAGDADAAPSDNPFRDHVQRVDDALPGVDLDAIDRRIADIATLRGQALDPPALPEGLATAVTVDPQTGEVQLMRAPDEGLEPEGLQEALERLPAKVEILAVLADLDEDHGGAWLEIELEWTATPAHGRMAEVRLAFLDDAGRTIGLRMENGRSRVGPRATSWSEPVQWADLQFDPAVFDPAGDRRNGFDRLVGGRVAAELHIDGRTAARAEAPVQTHAP